MAKKVMVVGDLIVDRYNVGDVQRVSPEAPVPVVRMVDSYIRLGGAANVACNIISLGGEAYLAGYVGDDFAGSSLKDMAESDGINISCIVTSKTFNTIEKMRVVGNDQQIVRVDFNDRQVVNEQDATILIENICKNILNVDIVVISDYAKGVCSNDICKRIIQEANENNKPVFVDPKGDEWGKYKNATLLSPNFKEMSEYLHIVMNNDNDDLEHNCRTLCGKIGIEYLLITRSEKGMTLIDRNERITHIESKAISVYDVSGAGDTVIAALSFFWNKTNEIEAVKYANRAAGIVVAKKGTASVTMEELRQFGFDEVKQIAQKIIGFNNLMLIVKKWKENKETIAFTNGCYDIFHKGHAYSIYSAAEYSDHLIVAVNSDNSVKRLKGKDRPINNELDRAYVVSALGCVDNVIIFDEDTPEHLLQFIKPDVLVKGGDYKEEEVIGREFANKVVLVEYIDGYSTTNTIEKMKANE